MYKLQGDQRVGRQVLKERRPPKSRGQHRHWWVKCTVGQGLGQGGLGWGRLRCWGWAQSEPLPGSWDRSQSRCVCGSVLLFPLVQPAGGNAKAGSIGCHNNPPPWGCPMGPGFLICSGAGGGHTFKRDLGLCPISLCSYSVTLERSLSIFESWFSHLPEVLFVL